MTTTVRSARTRKPAKPTPAPEVEVITAPSYAPDARPGVVLINGEHYLLSCWGAGPEDGYRVERLTAAGEQVKYDLHATCYGHLVCDCPSATYRPDFPCKHSMAVRQLRKQGCI